MHHCSLNALNELKLKPPFFKNILDIRVERAGVDTILGNTAYLIVNAQLIFDLILFKNI